MVKEATILWETLAPIDDGRNGLLRDRGELTITACKRYKPHEVLSHPRVVEKVGEGEGRKGRSRDRGTILVVCHELYSVRIDNLGPDPVYSHWSGQARIVYSRPKIWSRGSGMITLAGKSDP